LCTELDEQGKRFEIIKITVKQINREDIITCYTKYDNSFLMAVKHTPNITQK
jgi:hypothetical protein